MLARTLGHYEILEELGRGGMGEVYRARDKKLGRKVAIKTLPSDLTQSTERLARFEREARLLAALNHPHIAAIHGLEEHDGEPFLVLELVPGEDLAERLRRGPFSVEETLDIAGQIAEALEEAHERGIVHRDLKPANVKLTPEGNVKVLDFGLAKALSEESEGASPELSQSPTISRQATAAGVILGTAAYMSPEQAKGKKVDKRTDIWAFGAVLFELLTGRRAFGGEDVSDTLASILKDEPDWSRLPSGTPARLREILHRCLTKDASLRLRDIGEARIALREASDESEPDTPRRRSLVGLLSAAAVAGLLTGVAVWLVARPDGTVGPRPVTRSIVPLPPGTTLAVEYEPMVALSPDGRTAAFVAAENGQRHLYLRSLDSLESRRVAGSEGAVGPFFSPDGRWAAFRSDDSDLLKVSVRGGAPVTVATGTTRGAVWAADGAIVFNRQGLGLARVSSEGGEPEALTTPDLARGERSHRLPSLLPGERTLVFTNGSPSIESFDEAEIAALDLDSGKITKLVEGGTNPRYVSSGHLVYARAGDVVAVPFDASRLEVTGPPVTVLEGVLMHTISGNADIAISRSGDLLYAPGGAVSPSFRVVAIDREGSVDPLTESTGYYFNARLSPDESHLAINVAQANNSIWLYDRSRATMTRFVFGFENMMPVWDPSGARLAFMSNRAGGQRVFLKPVEGNDAPEQLTTGDLPQVPWSWSPDGRFIAYQEGTDLWVLPLDGDRKPKPFVQTAAGERWPRFAPEGRAIAFASDETGRDEVYVQSFPEPGRKLQVSTGGGTFPVWGPNGRELFYRVGDEIWAAAVGAARELGAPRALFDVPPNHAGPFDVTSDGKFVFIDQSDFPALPTHLVLVQNWGEELKRLAPADGAR